MSRPLFALTTALALAPALSAQAVTPVAECVKKIKADPKIVKAELKMVTLAPAGSQWAQEFQKWTDDAMSQSDCQIVLKWYWNGGGGGDELRMVTDLRGGQKHGAAMTAIGLGEIYKEVLLFTLPGLFDNWPALDAARNAEKEFFEAEFAKRGFVIVGWGDVGAAKVMSVGKPVLTPDDLKGQSAFYLPGDVVSPMFYAKVGVKGMSISLGELGSHIGKDIQILNISPYAAEQLQLSSKVTHLTAYTTAFVIGAVVLKKEKLDAMPADLREILLKTGKAASEALTNTIRNQDGQAFGRMKQTKITSTPNAEQVKAWQEILAATRKSLRGAPFAPDVFDRIVKR